MWGHLVWGRGRYTYYQKLPELVYWWSGTRRSVGSHVSYATASFPFSGRWPCDGEVFLDMQSERCRDDRRASIAIAMYKPTNGITSLPVGGESSRTCGSSDLSVRALPFVPLSNKRLVSPTFILLCFDVLSRTGRTKEEEETWRVVWSSWEAPS